MDKHIVESDYCSFDEYKRIVEKYTKNDPREVNFQNRVVLQILDKILINCKNVSVEDISTQYKNKKTSYHTRKYYAWKHTPDLLVVRDWIYENKGKGKEDYIAVVEIKSPILDPITPDPNTQANQHTLDEVNEYRENCDKVILTDCYRWILYEKNKEPECFVLHDDENWIMEKKENPEFICKEFGFSKYREESMSWKMLLIKLSEFLCEETVD